MCVCVYRCLNINLQGCKIINRDTIKNGSVRVGKLVKQLKVVVLAEDQKWVAEMHIRLLTTIYNSNFKESDIFFLTSEGTHMSMYPPSGQKHTDKHQYILKNPVKHPIYNVYSVKLPIITV